MEYVALSAPTRMASTAVLHVPRRNLPRHHALDALLHRDAELPGLDQLHEACHRVAEVEEVPLPRPVVVAGVAEPRASHALDLVVAAVVAGRGRDLAPERHDLAALLVDQHRIIW